MSADHEFKVRAWPNQADPTCAVCNRPRSEHPVEDGYERSDLPPREHPPTQVVEATCGAVASDGLGLCARKTGHPDMHQTLDGRVYFAATPTDPARKPADEAEAAAREIMGYLPLHPEYLPALRRFSATAREQGRQAGAEEMREACAKFLEQPVMLLAFEQEPIRKDVIRRIRALPIPEPRS